MVAESPALIILAAGEGRRMGKPKALLEESGIPLFLLHAESFRQSFCGPVALVLGNGVVEVFQTWPWLAEADLQGLFPVINHRPEGGPFSSLQEGLAELARLGFVETSAFVLPVDTPVLDASVWNTLHQGMETADAAVPVFEDRGGHPVLLSGQLCRLVRAAPRNSRLDSVLRELSPEKVIRVPVKDAGVTRNMNTPDLCPPGLS